MFVAVSNTLSFLSLNRLAFVIQSFHVNCNYSFPAILFTLIWKSSLHLFISENDFLPLNTNNP